MSKLDTSDKQAALGATPQRPKSAAASRILRAVEKSRTNADPTTTRTDVPQTAGAPEPEQPLAPPPTSPEPAPVAGQSAPEPAAAAASVAPPQPEELLKALSETIKPVVEPAPAPAEAVVSPEVVAPKEKGKSGRKNKSVAAKPDSNPAPEVELVFASATAASQSRIPGPIKIGAILLLVLGAGAYYKFGPGAPAAGSSAESGSPATTAKNRVYVPMSGVGGWSPNWGGEASKTSGRSISVFRPSMQQVNYRIEFEGQIEQKGFGWVFRAKDPANYYAYKIEVVKPGLEPLVALTRFSMKDGKESQRHYSLFEKPVRPDTVFRVRMDADKNEFKTWVNGQLMETWRDDQHVAGGVGLLTEKGEAAQVRKVQIYEMR